MLLWKKTSIPDEGLSDRSNYLFTHQGGPRNRHQKMANDSGSLPYLSLPEVTMIIQDKGIRFWDVDLMVFSIINSIKKLI